MGRFFRERQWELSYVLRHVLLDVQSWRNWPNAQVHPTHTTSSPMNVVPLVDTTTTVRLNVDGSWNQRHTHGLRCSFTGRIKLLDLRDGMSTSFGHENMLICMSSSL